MLSMKQQSHYFIYQSQSPGYCTIPGQYLQSCAFDKTENVLSSRLNTSILWVWPHSTVLPGWARGQSCWWNLSSPHILTNSQVIEVDRHLRTDMAFKSTGSKIAVHCACLTENSTFLSGMVEIIKNSLELH